MNVKASRALFFPLSFLSKLKQNVALPCSIFLSFVPSVSDRHFAVALPLRADTHTHSLSLSFPLMKSICKCTTRNEVSLSTHQWSLIFMWNEWQRNQRRLTFIVLKLYFQKSPFVVMHVNQIADRNHHLYCKMKCQKCWNKHQGEDC